MMRCYIEDFMTTDKELTEAEELIKLHPILEHSPFELRHLSEPAVEISEYLAGWSESEQEIYKDYYSDEI